MDLARSFIKLYIYKKKTWTPFSGYVSLLANETFAVMWN